MKTFFQVRQELSEQLKPEHQELFDKHKKAAEYHAGQKRRYSSYYNSAHPKTIAHKAMSSAHDRVADAIRLHHGGGKDGVHRTVQQHSQDLHDTADKHKNRIGSEHVSNAQDLHKSLSNMKEDSDAVKAFLAKGGKIKKLPPAKAQGYHGKDDPGKDIKGMLDKPDTKKSVMGTRKKAKSMEANEAMIIRSKKPASKLRRDAESRPTGVREISKGMAGRYLKKAPASAAQAGDMMARPTPGAPGSAATMDKGVKKLVKRYKGTSMAVDKLTGKAKVPAK